ncbi:MAG TPA: hypothetical protein PKN48_13730 [Bacteroidales bacterium]|nr:hypothetical protein [Bacteroidales bacterium]
MKKLTVIICLLLLVKCLSAQDIITMKDGTQIKSKILEVTLTEIKYKNFDELEGSTYTVQMGDISGFSYEEKTDAENGRQDVVYLKNGSIIRGKITEKINKKSLKIQTADSNVFAYNFNEVSDIKKEFVPIVKNIPKDTIVLKSGQIILGEITDWKENTSLQIQTAESSIFVFPKNEIIKTPIYISQTTQSHNKESHNKESGFTNITEFNFAMYDIDDIYEDYDFGIQTINGYKFNRHLSLALGIGAYFKAKSFPLFVDFRYNFLKSKVTPFLALDLGYCIFTGNDFITGKPEVNGGLLVAPAFGLKFFISPKTAINIGVGYWMQQSEWSSYTLEYWGWRKTGSGIHYSHNIAIKFGLSF